VSGERPRSPAPASNLHRALPGACGFGLRVPHYSAFLESGVAGADIVEAVTENFLGRGGRPRAVLERVRRDVPVVLHGVSLSIGGTTPLDQAYLRGLRELCERIEPAVVSDHLSFGTFGRHYAHDLWPLPFTEEALAHVVARVGQVQDDLGRRLALENVSTYLALASSELAEWEFLDEVARRADCRILLDVNNVHVNACNHGFSAERYVDGVSRERVVQFHLAGHLDMGSYLLDDHGSAVSPAVWALYERAVARFGPVPTIVEWDEDVPALDVLVSEADKARRAQARLLSSAEPLAAIG
jgi:uncharacterized protein (UPF0276 family)